MIQFNFKRCHENSDLEWNIYSHRSLRKYFIPFRVQKRSKFLYFVSCGHEQRPRLAISDILTVLLNGMKSRKLNKITGSDFSIHPGGLISFGFCVFDTPERSEFFGVWLFDTPGWSEFFGSLVASKGSQGCVAKIKERGQTQKYDV